MQVAYSFVNCVVMLGEGNTVLSLTTLDQSSLHDEKFFKKMLDKSKKGVIIFASLVY